MTDATAVYLLDGYSAGDELHAKLLADGWIEHDNGPCPIEGHIMCEVYHPDSSGTPCLSAGRAGTWAWGDNPKAFAPRSMYYRIVEKNNVSE